MVAVTPVAPLSGVTAVTTGARAVLPAGAGVALPADARVALPESSMASRPTVPPQPVAEAAKTTDNNPIRHRVFN